MPTQYEHDYMQLIKKIQRKGKCVESRNGGIQSIFGETFTVDNTDLDFPLLKGRKLPVQSALGEFAAMIRGPKTLEDFEEFGCGYWKDWSNPDGTIELDYGNAWIDYNGVNQVKEVVESLTLHPHHRRHLIDAWRPDRLKDLNLPCCHFLYQWWVDDYMKLHMIWYQRSVDVMIGLPADVILATVFNNCMAKETGLLPGSITFMLGDCHIYDSHLPNVNRYLANAINTDGAPIDYHWHSPKRPLTGPQLFEPDMIDIMNYQPVESILFEVIA